jgi:hypothetical protein
MQSSRRCVQRADRDRQTEGPVANNQEAAGEPLCRPYHLHTEFSADEESLALAARFGFPVSGGRFRFSRETK